METAMGHDDVEFERAIEVLEEQTSVLWRRERTTSHALAKNVHPAMEPAAYGILTLLQREGSLRATDIAQSIGVGKPSVSRQLGALEGLGLVTRRLDPLDARSQRVLLTPLGEQQLAAAQSGRRTAFTALMRSWDPEDVEVLGSLIARLNLTYTKDTW
ncbi:MULTISPECIES: MarR family winged helix-turn-helix transcriptional regulator [unclassified Arthrobacter]|jgi:DNA-binding MarR family transcriptional regulator|uniref:MarR family winged helix-turn-helix transcriptional regulator n=1 Tax=unclassified Arthrobacter TaxID=235627 RepID=UPI0006F4EF02|nr:MarR family transcriptional regulator [Arthrobacter sp. Leaf234]KQO03398.1 MarR family transcriptional regulator [Arthrobacter sp. Leaf234]